MNETKKKRILFFSLLTYLALFIVFLFNTRTPDYFESKKIKSVVSHFIQKSIKKRNNLSTPFPVLKFKLENSKDSFFCPLDKGFYFQNFSIGDSTTIIYNPLNPEECSFYTFPYYWLDLFDVFYFIFCSIFVLIFLKQILNKNDKDRNIKNIENLF